MDIDLCREEAVYLKVEGMLPISEEVSVIGQQEKTCLIAHVIPHFPIHIEFSIATEFAMGMLVGCNVKLPMVNFI